VVVQPSPAVTQPQRPAPSGHTPPPSRQVSKGALKHDIEDAWRLQEKTLGCHHAATELGPLVSKLPSKCGRLGPGNGPRVAVLGPQGWGWAGVAMLGPEGEVGDRWAKGTQDSGRVRACM